MRAGNLEQLAVPADLYNRPATAFVADFVGLTNRLDADVRDGFAEVLGVRLPVLPGSVDAGPATVLVRPEALAVEPNRAGDATVVSASFLGATGQVHLTTAAGEPLVAQIDNAMVAGYSPGDRVTITPRPTAALAVARG